MIAVFLTLPVLQFAEDRAVTEDLYETALAIDLCLRAFYFPVLFDLIMALRSTGPNDIALKCLTQFKPKLCDF